jgi:hypothetical protein
MIVRGLWLTLALFGSAPVEAASCHRYSRWYYPWPQSCGVARQMVRLAHAAPHKIIVAAGRNDFAPNRNDFEIPLPSLARADLDGGEADEATRAHALLRAALEAANGH